MYNLGCLGGCLLRPCRYRATCIHACMHAYTHRALKQFRVICAASVAHGSQVSIIFKARQLISQSIQALGSFMQQSLLSDPHMTRWPHPFNPLAGNHSHLCLKRLSIASLVDKTLSQVMMSILSPGAWHFERSDASPLIGQLMQLQF
jgi:hypothetical protein